MPDITVGLYADSDSGDCSTGDASLCNLRAALIYAMGLSRNITIYVSSSQTHAFDQDLGYITYTGSSGVTVETDADNVVVIDGTGNGNRFLYMSGASCDLTFGDDFTFQNFGATSVGPGTGLSSSSGGVCYLDDGAQLAFGDRVKFFESTASSGYGGAVYVADDDSQVTLGTDNVFNQNTAQVSLIARSRHQAPSPLLSSLFVARAH
jgi:hypothetical protein